MATPTTGNPELTTEPGAGVTRSVPRFGFKSLQGRILFFFLGLFALVQVIVLVAVTVTNLRAAKQQVRAELEITGRVFDRFVQGRVDQMTLAAKLLSGDFAFKQAYADGDRDTLLSAVGNLQEHRIGADLMIVVDAYDGSVTIDTLHPSQFGGPFAFPALLEASEDSGEPSTALVTIDDRLYRLVLVPLLAPEPVAWIATGFLVDDVLARSLRDLTLTDVSFLVDDGQGRWQIVASSMADHFWQPLANWLDDAGQQADDETFVASDGERYVALGESLGKGFRVVLLRSLDQALRPANSLLRLLLGLTLASLVVTALGAVMIARSVTRPILALVDSSRRIEHGDYQHRTAVVRRDEVGELAEAFNHMTQGLAAFQRYVPTELVRTLIERGVESKPEARLATMLFTDLEGFTTLGERLAPEDLVTLLDEYFTVVTRPIERFGGIILQYQGDAMLAVFNVPADDPEHASHALQAARVIQDALREHTFSGGRKLVTRIGINSGVVIAASVGSRERVNYTVHGDAVNLAARLEALNKEYGTRILVSEATVDLAGGGFELSRVAQVSIRGKQQKVTLYKFA